MRASKKLGDLVMAARDFFFYSSFLGKEDKLKHPRIKIRSGKPLLLSPINLGSFFFPPHLGKTSVSVVSQQRTDLSRRHNDRRSAGDPAGALARAHFQAHATRSGQQTPRLLRTALPQHRRKLLYVQASARAGNVRVPSDLVAFV